MAYIYFEFKFLAIIKLLNLSTNIENSQILIDKIRYFEVYFF